MSLEPRQPQSPLRSPSAEIAHHGELTGAMLFASDVRTTLLLVNEARYRTIEGVFGVRRDQVNLMTLIATMVLAEAAEQKTRRLRGVLHGPSRSDARLGVGLLSALADGIVGPASEATPLAGLLVASAVVGGIWVRAVRRSAHGMRTSAHNVRLSFGGRYGHRTRPALAR